MTTQIQDDIWCIDLGASTHMSYRRDWFTNYLKTDKKEVNCANDVKLTSEGIGDIRVNLEDTGKELNINNMSHVSGLNTNLLSISAMVKKNMSVFFSKERRKIFKNNDIKVQGEPILKVNEKNGIYVLGTNNDGCSTQEPLRSACLGSEISDGELWHRRMRHLSYSYLNNLKGLVTGLHFKEINYQLSCIPCLKGKQTRKPFKRSKRRNRANDILELVHSDVCGPMQTPSWGNARYLLTFIDDKTRKTFVYFLKGKDEVYTKFQEFKKLAETQTGKKNESNKN